MIFPCPHCGARSVAEFQFRHCVPRPSADPVDALHVRTNTVERSDEYWQHVRGCRAWLLVRRNPSTARIESVRLLGEAR